MAAESPTAAMEELYRPLRQPLSEYDSNLPYVPEAAGMVVAMNGRLAGAELFDQPRTVGVLRPSCTGILEGEMKITYDPEVDVLRLIFSSAVIEESDEEKPGIILDFDKDGNLVGMERLDASRRMENPRSVEYAALG